jgi:sulfate adenylyltransferase
MTTMISPHGGDLKNLLLPAGEAERFKQSSRDLPSWDLTPRQLCDIELLLNGGFSPLDGFLGRADYESVVESMRLANGLLWPIPVALDVTEVFAGGLSAGSEIALRDHEGVLIAVMRISDIWKPDRSREARLVYGTEDPSHPGVRPVLHENNPVYLGGALKGIEPPVHHDFRKLRESPAEMRSRFIKLGWHRVVGFHTHSPIHRAHFELTFRAAKAVEANLLIHPIVGINPSIEAEHFARVRSYIRVFKRYPEATTALSLIPLSSRMAGPREALWHALIRKNYGCTHIIIGKHHGSPGPDPKGKDFYAPYGAQDLFRKIESETGIEMIPFREMVYIENRGEYVPEDQVRQGESAWAISGTELRRRLQEGIEIPPWFSFPEVVEELQKTHPPRHRQGFTVFFTGLSGAGKSTLANALRVKLMEMGGRSVTLLDGDIVRKNLSSELGFSREHRDLNILRIGFVASEITKNGGIAICAPIAPYAATRQKVREMIAPVGGMVEIYVSTPIDVCEARDRKGLYAKARAGIIKQFTGISDPYEAPDRPELTIDTRDCSPEGAVQEIILKLENLGYIK